MIIITVIRSDGVIKGFSVKGHAGFKPCGEDIICAAVSMLAQTTLLGLGRYIKEGLSFSIDDDSGILKCALPGKLSDLEQIRAEAILETMMDGLKKLQKNYARHIRVFRRRWTPC